jgi:hypothetical protein
VSFVQIREKKGDSWVINHMRVYYTGS